MIISLDTECTGLDLAHGARPYLVTMHGQGWEAPVFWEWDVDPLTRQPRIPEEDLAEIAEFLDRAEVIYLQSAKYDARALATIGLALPWEKVRDTLCMGHLLASNHPHNLTDMCMEYLDADIEPLELTIKEVTRLARDIARRQYPSWQIAREGGEGMPSVSESSKRGEDKPWKNDMWLPRALVAADPSCALSPRWHTACSDYACGDSEHTLYLGLEMERRLRAAGLDKIHLRHRVHLPRIASEMESRGVTVVGEHTEDTIRKYEEYVAEAGDALVGMAQKEYNHDLKLAEGASLNDNMREFFYGSVVLKCPKCPYVKHAKHWNGEHVEDGALCPKCAKRKRNPEENKLWWAHRGNLALPVISSKTGGATLDANALKDYLLTAHDKARVFIKILMDKRKHDTDLTYMRGYRRFWVPIPREENRDYYRIHASFNPFGTDHLRWASSSPNCFDAETEILTTTGWVRADQLDEGASVAQYHRETGEIDFVTPSRLVKKRFVGSMHHIKTEEQIDMLLTPDHRCLVQNRRTLQKKVVSANEFPNDQMHIGAGVYGGGYESLTSEEVTWLCAVQADGSYRKEGGIRFAFKKERKIRRLRECLTSLGANYTEKVEKGVTCFYVGVMEEVTIMARAMMPNKFFGSWLIECNRKTIDLFLTEVFEWDGDYTRKAVYSSSDKVNTDWVQILFVLSGRRANIATRMPNNGWAVREHHYLNVTPSRGWSMTTNHTNELVPWDDYVYCVTVPSSYIVIRRNGKVSVTGNCQNIGKQEQRCEECDGDGCEACGGTGMAMLSMRYCFGPAPGREWYSADYESIEKRIPAYECREPTLLELFEKPNEPPFWGSDHNLLCSLLWPDKYYGANTDPKVGPVGTPLHLIKGAFKGRYINEYKRGKNTNFAKQYGAGKRKVDLTAGIRGAFELIDRGMPLLAALQADYLRRAEKTGYVETLPDRTIDPERGYPILASRTDDGRVLSTTPFNYHVSGTACQIKNRALVDCDARLAEWRREGFDGYICLEVHDEIVFDFPRGSEPTSNEWRARELRGIMARIGEDLIPAIPTPVSLSRHDRTWAEEVTIK